MNVGAGLVTPATDTASARHLSSVPTSAVPIQSLVSKSTSAVQESSKGLPVSGIASTSGSSVPPVSTRPKPKRRVKAVDSPANEENIAKPTPSASVNPPVQMGVDAALSTAIASPTPTIEIPSNDVPSKKPPPKTYGSKNKDGAAKNAHSVAKSTDTIDDRSHESRNTGVTKRKSLVDSESDYSDGGAVQKDKKSTRKPATKQKVAEVDVLESVTHAPKRAGRKRAIITSEDETEEEQHQTPDSKRRKESNERAQLPPPPTKSVDGPRDSSVDPLDMEVGSGTKGGRLELSIELSPSNSTKNFPPLLEVEGGILKSVPGNTKSPNKVHFVDGSAEEEHVTEPKPPASSKKQKSKPIMDDEYDEMPVDVPVADEDDEDDFVPSGGKKAKAKAKTAKAKKAAAGKDKVKSKKATQAKGKKGKAVEADVEPAVSEPPVLEASDRPLDLNEPTSTAVENTVVAPEPTNVPAAAPNKVKKIVVGGKKAPKPAEVIEDEEEPVVVETASASAKAVKHVEEKSVDDGEEDGEGGEKRDGKTTAEASVVKAPEVSISIIPDGQPIDVFCCSLYPRSCSRKHL